MPSLLLQFPAKRCPRKPKNEGTWISRGLVWEDFCMIQDLKAFLELKIKGLEGTGFGFILAEVNVGYSVEERDYDEKGSPDS
jgi:hypothetical protein